MLYLEKLHKIDNPQYYYNSICQDLLKNESNFLSFCNIPVYLTKTFPVNFS